MKGNDKNHILYNKIHNCRWKKLILSLILGMKKNDKNHILYIGFLVHHWWLSSHALLFTINVIVKRCFGVYVLENAREQCT
jgi:hypothetical protein